MVSDMFTSDAPLTLQELENTQNLDLYHPNLTRADRWALNNCIFLAFDDLSLDQPNLELESTDSQAPPIRQCVTSTSDTGSSGKNVHDDGPSTPNELPSVPDASKHKCRQPQSCKTCIPVDCKLCSHLLDFPSPETQGRVRRLREVDPRQFYGEEANGLYVCAHFLAISYCRTDLTDLRGFEKGGHSSHTYEIRRLDGSIRRNRVPDHILDQAICASFVSGCRLFWVDLESSLSSDCADGWREPQLSATRNWDIMFDLAHSTAGLLSVEIDSCEELQALSWMAGENYRLQEQDESRRSEILYHLVHLLDRIRLDRWYTCASTLKEMIDAEDDLLLVNCRDATMSWDYTTWPPPGSRASLQRRQTSEVVCLPLADLQRIVKELLLYLEGNEPSSSSRHHEYWRCGHPRPALAAVSSVGTLHPRVRSPALRLMIRVTDCASFTPGPRADAAAPLTLLKRRVVMDDSQFLGLLSDLCRYETRYRPESIANFRGSMRAAVLRLSLLNGDFSLLAPEAYGSHRSRRYHCSACDQINTDSMSDTNLPTTSALGVPQWLRPFDKDTSTIDLPDFYRANFARQTGASTYDPIRFRFPAYLWKVDSTIDMSFVQKNFRDDWLRLRPLCFTLRSLEGETPEDMTLRGHQLSAMFQDKDIRGAVQNDLLCTGTVGEHNPVWRMVPRAGCDISMMTLTQSIMENDDMRIALTGLLLNILLFLHREGESGRQPLAQGVANSIWQSMRVDALPPGDNHLPDEVGPALFENSDMQTSADLILRLDAAQAWRGEFYESWLLDRIMMNGQLWVGRYKREMLPWPPGLDRREDQGPQTLNKMDRGSPNAFPQPAASEEAGSCGTHWLPSEQPETWQSISDGQPGPSRTSGNEEESGDKKKKKKLSRIERQLLNMGIAGGIRRGQWDEAGTEMLSEQDDKHIPTGHMLSFMSMIASKDDSPVGMDERRARTLVSVFDVDGPCCIATPYSSDWEVLPHPEYRSMSVCWVVEPCPKEDKVGGSISTPREQPDTIGASSKGKQPASAMGAADEQQFPPDDVSAWPSPPSSPSPDTFLRGRYRVVGKVKGMWEIMDMPWQQYQFI